MSDRERELEAELSNLQGDGERIHDWGEQNPEAFSSFRFDHGPLVKILVYLAGGHLHEHEVELRALVDFPESVEVRQANWALSQLQIVHDEVFAILDGERGSFSHGGIGQGTVNITLKADKEVLALRLHQQFGDALSLTVGSLPYPPGRPATWVENLRPIGESPIPIHLKRSESVP
jgi:hypothetical protein